MTRISSYIIDQNIVGNDKWIGSDAQNNLRTKNFTPNNLADYFNGNNVIDIGTSIRYRYQTLDVGEEREQGTISFETEIGPQVNFSDITTFLIAKNTLKGNTVTDYLDFLVDGKVILSKSSNINTFGYYKITSIEPWIVDPNFFVVIVEFLDGNGFIYEDLDYLVSLVDKSSGSGGAQTLNQTLVNGNATDGEDIFLSDGDSILLDNGSKLKKGTTNAGNGGNNGIALKCSLDYEFKWEAGRMYIMQQDGVGIRETRYNFNVAPTVNDDDTKGYAVDSRWILDNGDLYVCTDATTGGAVWELQSTIPTLQEVLDNNHDLVDGNFFAGTDAGDSNTGVSVIGVGESAGNGNSGDNGIFLGNIAGLVNTGISVNALGSSAGVSNAFNYVNLFGESASADEDGQTVLSKDGAIMARISTTNLTDTRKYNLPDADGTIALTSDITIPTLQEVMEQGRYYTQAVGDYSYYLGYSGSIFIQDIVNDITNVSASIIYDVDGKFGTKVLNFGPSEGKVIYDDDLLTGKEFSTFSSFGFNKLKIPFRTSNDISTDPPAEFVLPNNKNSGVYTLAITSDIPTVTGYVPYTGATQDVNLGEFGLLTGNIEFDNTPTNLPTAAGSMYYNDTDGTVDLILKGGNVKLQIGQESVIRVVNKTATNINLLEANYQAVRVTGAQGQRLKVDLAQATTDNLSAETIGLVTETINNNQEGFITTNGLVRNINTTGSLQGETWADGDILYLSPTTAGRATKVKPSAPNHLVILGYVIHAHPTQGSIFVKVDNGYELDELHNVKIDTPLNNQALVYNSTLDVWENKTITVDATPTDGSSNAVSSNGVFDALAIRQRYLVKDTVVSSPVTGTLAETLVKSYTIPANTLGANDYFRINCITSIKTGVLDISVIRVRISNTNTFAGSSLISTTAHSATAVNMKHMRDFAYRGGVLKGAGNTTTVFQDKDRVTTAYTSTTINFTLPVYVFVSIQNSNLLDSTVVEDVLISN